MQYEFTILLLPAEGAFKYEKLKGWSLGRLIPEGKQNLTYHHPFDQSTSAELPEKVKLLNFLVPALLLLNRRR